MPNSNSKITPHLWFDKEAREAAEFYTSVFPEGRINRVTTLHNTPSGDTEIVSFEIFGQPFMGISAGPLFKFNPSISFHVKCKTTAEVDAFWEKLSAGGTVLMERGAYPWSKWYGWVQDRYGLSWQVILVDKEEITQRIMPALMFVGSVCGRAEEAANFYTGVFPNSKIKAITRYGAGEQPDQEGTVKYAEFSLLGQEFGIMDSAYEHGFAFNEAISLIVKCDTQAEIDTYWEKLSADPEAEVCGWRKDPFGVAWQITPTAMDAMMENGDPEQVARVTEAFLKMKKFDLAELQRAYEGG